MGNNKKKRKVPMGYAALYACSVWVGRDRQSLQRLITEKGITPLKVGRYEYYRVSEVVDALIGGDKLDLQQERAQLARTQREKAALQIEEMERHLVPMEEVSQLWQRMVSAMRARLLSIPSKTAPMVLTAEKQSEIMAILKEQVNEALEELREEMSRFAN